MVTEIELEKLTDYAQSVSITIDGETEAYAVGTPKFNSVCAAWNDMLVGAHLMPAFGVSINDLTLREMQKGVWAEFAFGGEFSAGGMPFEKLLINAQPDWSGFNVIRYSAKRGYDGRCFYYDLVGKTMRGFYDCLINM